MLANCVPQILRHPWTTGISFSVLANAQSVDGGRACKPCAGTPLFAVS
jgi:hypothetical protein